MELDLEALKNLETSSLKSAFGLVQNQIRCRSYLIINHFFLFSFPFFGVSQLVLCRKSFEKSDNVKIRALNL